METITTLARKPVYQTGDGRFLKVEEHVVRFPDGRIIADWPWLDMPSFINVAAVTTEGQFLCFRQPKYAVAGLSLALPGGYLEPAKTPWLQRSASCWRRPATWPTVGRPLGSLRRGREPGRRRRPFLPGHRRPLAAARSMPMTWKRRTFCSSPVTKSWRR